MKKKDWKPMREGWDNNIYSLNGRVKPPIVLHNEGERLVAQGAHNLIWEKYREEWNEIAKEGADTMADDHKAMRAKAKPMIDELIIAEITAYRASKTSGGCNLHGQIEKLEREIAALRSELEEAQSLAEEAISVAEEARDMAEEVLSATEDIRDSGDSEE